MSDRSLLIFIAAYCAFELLGWVINVINDFYEAYKEYKEDLKPKEPRKTFHEKLAEKMKENPPVK